MSFRINTNTQSAFALSSLNKTSNEIGMRQMRLSTGSRINSASDDSAGFTIANKLQAKTRGQAQALSNIGDAKSMLTVAEGSLGSTMDILQTIKEKVVQAGNASMGTEERAAIQSQVDALTAEVSDILGGAEFNGTKLFSDTEDTTLSFQVGDASGDTFGLSTGQLGVATLGLGTVGGSAGALETGDFSGVSFTGAGSGEAEYRIQQNGSDLELQRKGTDGTFSTIAGYEDLAALQADGDVAVTDGDFSFTLDAAAELSNGASFSIEASSASLANSGNTTGVSGIAYGGAGTAASSSEYRVIDGATGGGTDFTLQKKGSDGTYANVAGYVDFTADQSVTDGDFSFDLTFASLTAGAEQDFKIAYNPAEAAAVTLGNAGASAIGGSTVASSLDLTSDSGVASALTTIDAAIKSVSETASKLGDVQNRLDFKSQNLETSMNNYDAARSRIADADFAKEQMEIVKLQILQQTGSAMFAQSNAAPQSVLSFF